MNKGVLIGIVAVVVVGVGAWYVFGKGGAGMPAPAESTGAQSGGMEQLIAKGNAQCTVSSEANGVVSNGTVFVANGKVRGTFTSTGGGMPTTESNMIVRDGFVHVWSSAMPQGIKMVAQASTEAQASTQANNPYDANYTYDCDSWTPDESKFTLPSGITFTDFSAAAGAQGSVTPGPSCAQCDMVPAGPSRDSCKAALKCN